MNITKEHLAEFTSLRIGGVADMVHISGEAEVANAARYAREHGKALHVLGGGTNTFFGERLDGLLIMKMEMKGVSMPVRHLASEIPVDEFEQSVGGKEEGCSDTILVTAMAGEMWDDLVHYSVDKNLWGLENLSHIPGTVGAAPVQNIGAYGVDLADSFYALRAYDLEVGEFVEFTKEDCRFGYRDSVFKQQGSRYIIVSVTLMLSKNPKPVLVYKPLDALQDEKDLSPQTVRGLVIQTRASKLPDYVVYPNAGSFFKNPVVTSVAAKGLQVQYPDIPLIAHGGCHKIPAAWLIEHVAHMKGVRVGDVGTWPRQPLVIVNYGHATGRDIVAFSDKVIALVSAGCGVLLEREVQSVLVDSN